MATYSTDLTTLTTAESGTWTEFSSPYDGGGSPGSNTEAFIQGTACYSQTTGKATGLEISCVFDYGSGYSFSTDDVVYAWVFYANGTNLETYANSGWRYGIGSSTSAWDWFRIGGSDYGKNPYGGWFNIAIDPTATQSGTIGGGNGGTYRYFGSVPYTIGEVFKGEPSAQDAIRAGRGELSVTGTGSSFSEIAEYNDYNAGSTPPGTSSTSVDSGRHRLGIFQDNGGVYLFKGLLSFGLTATSVTFSDSNETIIIDDCPHTYAAFNKIEVHNSSSSVTLTNISFVSTASTANGVGHFEMVDNATVSLNGCTFNNMGTFVFDSNGSITGCAFNGCGQITHGGADFESSNFQGYEGTAGTAYMTYAETVDPDGELDNCSFTKGTAATHAIEFDSTNTPTTITLRGIDFSGYNAVNGNNDSALYFPSTTKSYTVNLIGCSGNISYRVGSGGSVTLVTNPVTLKATVKDNATALPIQNARVYAEVTSGVNFPYNASVSISGTTPSTEDSYAGSDDGAFSLYDVGNHYCGQSFTASNNSPIVSMSFRMLKNGTPPGYMYAQLYASTGSSGSYKPTGSPLATSAAILANTLSAGVAPQSFYFYGDQQYTLTSSTVYIAVVKYTEATPGNYIDLAYDNTTPSHAGNTSSSVNGSVWGSDATKDFNFDVKTGGTTSTVTHTSHGLSTNDYVVIKGANEDVYNGQYQITVTGANAYTYTTTEAIGLSTATGTITSTYVLLSGLTDVNGEIQDSWSISNDQPFLYRIRKSTTSPFYVQGAGTDTLDNIDGLSFTVQLTRDE